MNHQLTILGIRGVPAAHGGFETFAERLSLYLVAQGWRVTVYCQEQGQGPVTESEWQGVRRVHVPVRGDGALSTIVFDWKVARHARRQPGLCLTLGYNTALFNLWQRLSGQINLFNMDGLEWQRDKWSTPARVWLWVNERAGCLLGQHLIADHPRIKDHLATRVSEHKITMIPYGADELVEVGMAPLAELGLEPNGFSVVIARPEPENSVLEMVQAFSVCERGHRLVILGHFTPETNDFHRRVLAAASAEVIFPGAIYDTKVVGALRWYSRFYLHGHRVGGTNPSLVEAMGAGCAVIAHDNQFNRWVVGEGAAYFSDTESCARLFDDLLKNDAAIGRMQNASRLRFRKCFTWPRVLAEYEALLTHWLSAP
jgi:glycosyltransferase involved in cell wall biosynthesis